MREVVFFQLSDGYGVVLEVDNTSELPKLKKALSSKKLEVQYNFDFENMMSYLEIGELRVKLLDKILESIIELNSPKMHIYLKGPEDITSEYICSLDLDVTKLIRLDSIYKVSSSFLTALNKIQKVDVTTNEDVNLIEEEAKDLGNLQSNFEPEGSNRDLKLKGS